MTENSVLLDIDESGVATLTINRAEIHNAFDDQLIQSLHQVLELVETDPKSRLLVVRSEGKNFSAGADLNWMRRMADFSHEENHADAMELAMLMKKLNCLSIPTIARVQGAAFGGGVGLVACCDIAVASTEAKFCFSEVRLGLIPATISPYVIAAVGERTARRYFQTAECFGADEAKRIGLLHEVVDESELDIIIDDLVDHLLKGGPNALTAAKDLIFSIAHQQITDGLIEDSAEHIATIRSSDEAKEGITAFLEKRPTDWSKDDD